MPAATSAARQLRPRRTSASDGSDDGDRGNGCRLFDLGGLRFRLGSTHRGWLAAAGERYRDFAVPSDADEPAIAVDYTVAGDSVPSADVLYRARQQPLRSRRCGSRWQLHGDGFDASIDDPGNRVRVSGPLATYPVDLLLRALWYEHVGDGLIVHAAALAAGDRGWLCAGESGAGKSTLAGLFPEAALSDEFAGVRLGDAGATVAGLPFWQGRPGTAKLEKVYLLRHGESHRRRRLSPAAAFARLRGQIAWPAWDRTALAHSFANLARLVERVEVHELSFRPERSVWPVLTGRTAGARSR